MVSLYNRHLCLQRIGLAGWHAEILFKTKLCHKPIFTFKKHAKLFFFALREAHALLREKHFPVTIAAKVHTQAHVLICAEVLYSKSLDHHSSQPQAATKFNPLSAMLQYFGHVPSLELTSGRSTLVIVKSIFWSAPAWVGLMEDILGQVVLVCRQTNRPIGREANE